MVISGLVPQHTPRSVVGEPASIKPHHTNMHSDILERHSLFYKIHRFKPNSLTIYYTCRSLKIRTNQIIRILIQILQICIKSISTRICNNSLPSTVGSTRGGTGGASAPS